MATADASSQKTTLAHSAECVRQMSKWGECADAALEARQRLDLGHVRAARMTMRTKRPEEAPIEPPRPFTGKETVYEWVSTSTCTDYLRGCPGRPGPHRYISDQGRRGQRHPPHGPTKRARESL